MLDSSFIRYLVPSFLTPLSSLSSLYSFGPRAEEEAHGGQGHSSGSGDGHSEGIEDRIEPTKVTPLPLTHIYVPSKLALVCFHLA